MHNMSFKLKAPSASLSVLSCVFLTDHIEPLILVVHGGVLLETLNVAVGADPYVQLACSYARTRTHTRRHTVTSGPIRHPTE